MLSSYVVVIVTTDNPQAVAAVEEDGSDGRGGGEDEEEGAKEVRPDVDSLVVQLEEGREDAAAGRRGRSVCGQP